MLLTEEIPEQIDEARSLGIGPIVGGTYRILRKLGEGGFALVYLAQHERIRTLQVAVKVLKRERAHDQRAVARFLHEAETVAALKNPNVVGVRDFGETESGLPYLVMEYVSGPLLSDVIDVYGRLNPGYVARISREILQALEAAHAKGVVHRDLKPANVFLVPSEAGKHPALKVGDFGIAKVLEPTQHGPAESDWTDEGVVLCTPHYAAPELLRGSPSLRSDIYALGHMMIEMLEGETAYDGTHPMIVSAEHLRDEPVPLSAAVESSGLFEVVARAVDKDPDTRFQTAAEMHAALDAATANWDADLTPLDLSIVDRAAFDLPVSTDSAFETVLSSTQTTAGVELPSSPDETEGIPAAPVVPQRFTRDLQHDSIEAAAFGYDDSLRGADDFEFGAHRRRLLVSLLLLFTLVAGGIALVVYGPDRSHADEALPGSDGPVQPQGQVFDEAANPEAPDPEALQP